MKIDVLIDCHLVGSLGIAEFSFIEKDVLFTNDLVFDKRRLQLCLPSFLYNIEHGKQSCSLMFNFEEPFWVEHGVNAQGTGYKNFNSVWLRPGFEVLVEEYYIKIPKASATVIPENTIIFKEID